MTAYLSFWARRIEELVQWGIDSTNYEETVSTLRVHKSLNHLGMLKAKHIEVMGDEVPKRNPWLASLCLYVAMGDAKPSHIYHEHELLEARVYLGHIQQAGWSAADMFQAIEWNKTSMANYPTPQQWASVLEISVESVQEAQSSLVPTMALALSVPEQQAWSMACQVELPFYSWLTCLQQQSPPACTPLPDMEP